MRQLNSRNIDRATIINGYISISTPSCGCCSEYYTNDPDTCSGDWEITVDELSKHVENLENRLDNLKGYLEELANLQIDNLRHIDKD